MEEEKNNLNICPNCLEPNPDDLAVCKYCGMPLHPGAEPVELNGENADGLTSEEEMAENRAAAVPSASNEKKEEPRKNGFNSIMPFLGLYVLYSAYQTWQQVRAQIANPETEEAVNPTLGYVTVAIYAVAGLLMLRPWIEKAIEMIRGPKAEEPAEAAAAETAETAETDEEPEAAVEACEESCAETAPVAESAEAETPLNETDDEGAATEPAENSEVPESSDEAENVGNSEEKAEE